MGRTFIVFGALLMAASFVAAQTSSTKPSTAAKPTTSASASQPTAVIDTTAGKMNCTLFPIKPPSA